MERLKARVIGELPELPEHPGAELVLYLLARPGWRSRTELQDVLGDVDAALATLAGTPYQQALEKDGERLRLNADSDVTAFWEDAYRDWGKTVQRYGELAPGFSSPITQFQEWLQSERQQMLHALWGTAIGKAGALMDEGARDAAVSLLRGAEQNYPYEPASALDLADAYWRARLPDDTARVIEAVMPLLSEEILPRARLNLAAALLRGSDKQRALQLLQELAAEGGVEGAWAELHRGSLAVLQGDAATALRLAEEAYRFAEKTSDGDLAIAALMLRGEALTAQGDYRGAVHALGEALGIHEIMKRSFSPLTLALLAQAQSLWGYPQKGVELAEKAFKDARLQHDPYAASRALWALYQASGEKRYVEMALREAEAAGHRPWMEYLQKQA